MTICLNCDSWIYGKFVLCCTCGHFCSKKCMEEYHIAQKARHKPELKEN